MMLVRKLRQKYIDSNPAFAAQSDESSNTCNFLKNNFISNERSKRYNQDSSIDYGSVPLRQPTMQGKTRNEKKNERYTLGNSNNTLPRILN